MATKREIDAKSSERLERVREIVGRGPKTTEDVSRELARLGDRVTLGTVRQKLVDAEASRLVCRRTLKTPRFRNGIVIWYQPGDDARLAEVIASLEGLPAHEFHIGKMKRTA